MRYNSTRPAASHALLLPKHFLIIRRIRLTALEACWGITGVQGTPKQIFPLNSLIFLTINLIFYIKVYVSEAKILSVSKPNHHVICLYTAYKIESVYFSTKHPLFS